MRLPVSRTGGLLLVAAFGVATALGLGYFLRERAIPTARDLPAPDAPPPLELVAAPVVSSPALSGQADDRTTAFCSACHAMPRPESFPKSAWKKEVQRGFDFYLESRRADLAVPVQEKVVAYFRSRAPDRLASPQLAAASRSSDSLFREQDLKLDGEEAAPAISHLHAIRLGNDHQPSLVYCDMETGEVGAVGFSGGQPVRSVIASLSFPCHVESCDLDRDGRVDLVIADLGSFEPADHNRGRILWLRQPGGAESTWESHVLCAGLGRVADVQPGDFDGDGNIDLVVAEFGYHSTGRILLLRNRSLPAAQPPEFDVEVIDARHGTIHVPVADLDGDGRLDFVALISQEHEVIEAFLNMGQGKFHRETIHEARDPAYGSTGVALVDLDADGDLDVLYTNGDTLDSYLVKPYHAVSWLENAGRYPFEHHVLTTMPGVMRAVAVDLDCDGLLDVVASSFLTTEVLANSAIGEIDSLIWLRQGPDRRFSRYSIEIGNPRHMSLELLDADGDGFVDIFTGNFSSSPEQKQAGPRITAWWNLHGAGSSRVTD